MHTLLVLNKVGASSYIPRHPVPCEQFLKHTVPTFECKDANAANIGVVDSTLLGGKLEKCENAGALSMQEYVWISPNTKVVIEVSIFGCIFIDKIDKAILFFLHILIH